MRGIALLVFSKRAHAILIRRDGVGPLRWCSAFIRGSGTLLGRLHPQHLYPCHGGDEAGRRRHHWERHQPSNVRYVKKSAETCISEKHEKAAKISTGQGKSYLVLSNPFRSFPLMGHGLGRGKSEKIQTNYLDENIKKSS